MASQFFEKLPLPYKAGGNLIGWVGGQYVSAHPDLFPAWVIDVAPILAAGFILSFLWYSLNYWREIRGKSRFHLDPQVILILCLLGALGASTLQWWRRPSSTTAVVAAPMAKANEPSPQATLFLKDIKLSAGKELHLTATPTQTVVTRLRVFADITGGFPGAKNWPPITRVEVGELIDVVKGRQLSLKIIMRDPSKGRLSDLFWGQDSASNNAVSFNPGIRSVVHARLAILGPDGIEQPIYFMLLLTDVTETEGHQMLVVNEGDLDWINDWKATAK